MSQKGCSAQACASWNRERALAIGQSRCRSPLKVWPRRQIQAVTSRNRKPDCPGEDAMLSREGLGSFTRRPPHRRGDRLYPHRSCWGPKTAQHKQTF